MHLRICLNPPVLVLTCRDEEDAHGTLVNHFYFPFAMNRERNVILVLPIPPRNLSSPPRQFGSTQLSFRILRRRCQRFLPGNLFTGSTRPTSPKLSQPVQPHISSKQTSIGTRRVAAPDQEGVLQVVSPTSSRTFQIRTVLDS